MKIDSILLVELMAWRLYCDSRVLSALCDKGLIQVLGDGSVVEKPDLDVLLAELLHQCLVGRNCVQRQAPPTWNDELEAAISATQFT